MRWIYSGCWRSTDTKYCNGTWSRTTTTRGFAQICIAMGSRILISLFFLWIRIRLQSQQPDQSWSTHLSYVHKRNKPNNNWQELLIVGTTCPFPAVLLRLFCYDCSPVKFWLSCPFQSCPGSVVLFQLYWVPVSLSCQNYFYVLSCHNYPVLLYGPGCP